MADFHLYLLGPPDVMIADKSYVFSRKKSLALFIYLYMSRVSHNRDFLAHLFYPRQQREMGRSNLRHIISLLKSESGHRCIECSRVRVSLSESVEIDSDVESLRHLERVSARWSGTIGTEEIVDTADRVTDLYRGYFLEGFFLKDCCDFEQWQYITGDELLGIFRDIMFRCISLLDKRGCCNEAIKYVIRLLEADYFDEYAQRLLMRLYSCIGKKHQAIRQFTTYRRFLEEKWGERPESETTELYRRITGMHVN